MHGGWRSYGPTIQWALMGYWKKCSPQNEENTKDLMILEVLHNLRVSQPAYQSKSFSRSGIPLKMQVFETALVYIRGHLRVWRWIALKPSTVYPLNLRPHCNEHSLRRLQSLVETTSNSPACSIPILPLQADVRVNIHLQHRCRCIT